MDTRNMYYCMGDSLKRKKHQRKINKIIRRINKGIEEDELWKGRFFIKIVYTEYKIFEDKSGAVIYALVKFCDKKTGYTYCKWFDEYDFVKYRIDYYLNKFIVEYCNVWENENPKEDKTDYTKVEFKEKK